MIKRASVAVNSDEDRCVIRHQRPLSFWSV